DIRTTRVTEPGTKDFKNSLPHFNASMRPAGETPYRPRYRKMIKPWKPGKAQVLAARDKVISDLAHKTLTVLFVGINPGLYSAAIGCHFGRPGNRFWSALHGGGFTPRLFSPFEQFLLLDLHLGITNVVERATARAEELTDDEIRAGGRRLQAKVR